VLLVIKTVAPETLGISLEKYPVVVDNFIFCSFPLVPSYQLIEASTTNRVFPVAKSTRSE